MKKILLILFITDLIFACQPKQIETDPIKTIQRMDGDLVIRFAKLEIDSTQLDEYFVFLKEGIETSIATEPGVLTMYGVQEQNDPTKVTMLEIYLNDSAYQSHLKTPHFLKYKNGTLEMVKSLELVDLNPVVFGVRNE